MDLVTTLRSARERRGLSVEGLARATKIKPTILHAIERGDFDHIPAGIFRRGFLRSYAREVGLDADAVVRQYAEEFESAPVAEAARPANPAPADVAPFRSTDLDSDDRTERTRADVQWVAIGLVIAALAAFWLLSSRFRGPETTAAGRSTTPTAAPAARPEAAPATKPGTTATGPIATSGTALRIELTATGPCWVSAVSGGERLLYTLLQAGEHRIITAHDDVVLRVGDPGALTYTINGARGRPLGPPGQPVTVRLSPTDPEPHRTRGSV